MLARESRVTIFISVVSVLVGISVITGWVFNIPFLKSVAPEFVDMKFNTAICFIGCGLCLYFHAATRHHALATVVSLMILFIGAASLYEDIFKVQFGIDQLFVKDTRAIMQGLDNPGRPAPGTSFCFVLTAIAFILLAIKNKKAVLSGQVLFHIVTIISFIALLGYIYNIAPLHKLFFFHSLAVHTAALLLLISAAAPFIHPAWGIAALFKGNKSGNLMIRRLFPQMTVILIAVGVLELALLRRNVITHEFGVALHTVLFILLVLFLLWNNLNKLNHFDDKKNADENHILNLNKDLQKTIKDLEDYKYALDASSVVTITDEYDRILYANDNFCKVSKYSRDEVIGQNHRIVNSGFHSKDFFGRLWSTIAAGKIWKGEIKNRAKDGTIYWVDTAIVPFLDSNKKPVKYLAIRNVITERKEAERKLKASEENYRSIYENSIVAMITSDMKTLKPLMVNDIGVQMFGYASKRDFIEHYDPEKHFVDYQSRRKNIETILVERQLDRVEQFMKLDGSRFWAKLFIKLNPDQSLAHSVIVDISELVLSKQQLSEKIRELEIMNKELESFNYLSSHDLQEPLRKIRNFIDVLFLESKSLPDKEKFYLRRISETTDQMRALIEDLLTYSRLKKTSLTFDEVNMKQLINEVLNSMEEEIKEKGAVVEVKSTCQINGIRVQLLLLLKNLIENSLKFSAPERPLKIEVQCDIHTGDYFNYSKLDSKKQYYNISVKDNGIGFDPKYNDRIFEIFERLNDPHKYKGTGIGLAICHKIAEHHHGFITARGKINNGSLFNIYIPVEDEHV